MRPKPDFLPRMRGATGSVAGRRGLVPKPAAADNVKYLKGDGSWSALANASAATNAEAAAGASTTTFLTPAGATLSAGHAGRSSRPGIISTGASAVGTTQDNTGLAVGTGNRAGAIWARLPDWTPASNVPLWTKFASNLGTKLWVTTTGLLRLEYGNGSNFSTYRFDSTVATGVADGAWAFIAWSEDRAGNVSFYVNGTLLGTAVAISGAAAQTVTNTGALLWGSDGSTHMVGTLGETFIISGLLTATQVADIYRAGSIAPFAASFTFFQWVDFGQGYGPIIKDRSGQNQPALMGTSGLTHAVPRNPPGVPQRAPRAALVGDGSNGSLIRSTLGTQNPSTGEFVLMWDGVYPTETGNTDRALMALSSSSSTNVSARSFVVTKRDDLGFLVNLYGATGGVDYRYRASLALHNALKAYAGRVSIWVTRTKVYVGIAGDLFDVSNLFTADVTAGSPPAWTDQVDGQYLLGFYTNSTASSAASLFDLRLANVAMTEAQLRTEYERGEPGPEWQNASKTPLYSLDFGTGTNSFASDGTCTMTANVDADADGAGVPPTNDWLKCAAVLTQSYIYRTVFFARRGYYRISGQVFVPTGSGVTHIGVATSAGYSAANVSNGVQFVVATTVNAAVSFSGVVHSDNINELFGLGVVDAAGAKRLNLTAGDTVYYKAVTVEFLGYTSRLRTDTAAGLTALNGAKSATNDSSDFLLSTTGVTVSPDGRTQTVRATTNTSGNQQLFGASVIDTTKRWRIRSWNINSSGTPTVSLGNVSAGAQYLSGSALTATNNEVTLLTRIPGTANLWCNANSTATLEHTVILDLVD